MTLDIIPRHVETEADEKPMKASCAWFVASCKDGKGNCHIIGNHHGQSGACPCRLHEGIW